MNERIWPIATALLVGAVLGSAMTSVFHLGLQKADAGDWLQFLGTAFAVISSSLLTLWIERRTARATDDREHGMVRNALAALRDAVKEWEAQQTVREDMDSDRRRDAVAARKIASARRKFLFVHENVIIEDLDLFDALIELKDKISGQDGEDVWGYADYLERSDVRPQSVEGITVRIDRMIKKFWIAVPPAEAALANAMKR